MAVTTHHGPTSFTLTEGDLVLKGTYQAPANGHDQVTITQVDLNGSVLSNAHINLGPGHATEAAAQALIALITGGGGISADSVHTGGGGVTATENGNHFTLQEGSIGFAGTLASNHGHETVDITQISIGSDTLHVNLHLVGQAANEFVNEITGHLGGGGGSGAA